MMAVDAFMESNGRRYWSTGHDPYDGYPGRQPKFGATLPAKFFIRDRDRKISKHYETLSQKGAKA